MTSIRKPFDNRSSQTVSFSSFILVQSLMVDVLDKVPGSGESFTDYNSGTLNYYMPTDNMFSTSRDEDKKFEVFPEAGINSCFF